MWGQSVSRQVPWVGYKSTAMGLVASPRSGGALNSDPQPEEAGGGQRGV